uniref:Uncharacterized protein n=1 Tax=Salix viminalis TaxID=40686 RepID=A0A6N2MCX9_SALVM
MMGVVQDTGRCIKMEVEIISKEILKPSSSTPQHLRTYKLSVLDQLAPPLYIPIILFYSPPCENFCKNSDHLKESFSRTLTHFYPFAGRVKDDFSIDCNDDGAAFIEARVSGDMSMVIEQADINEHQQLLPCSPYAKISKLSTDQVTLAVQVNYFNCGGMAISICIWHAVADGSALATFVKSWAAITRDPNNVLDEVAIANWPEIESSALNYNSLAGKLDESIRKMNDEYIRKFHAGGGYFNFIKRAREEVMKGSNMVVFSFSSWCKFPFYEADFGWGKPIRLSPALQLNRVAIFLDTADGEGIEAWISLSKEDMVMFEQHPGIFTYASFSPSI